jgi:serine O-acetyltransferase
MKILNIQQFGKDMVEILALHGGKINPDKWETFFNNYFKKEIKNDLQKNIMKDLNFFRDNDPASTNYTWDQILSVRRGMIAITAHRIFQKVLLYNNDFVFEMEVLAKLIQAATNVEIHPEAQFGNYFAIDHGHGTVIGATTIAGNNIFIYHGVTLGATGTRSKTNRRHPKLGNHIFLGNGAQILGPSIVKDNVKIDGVGIDPKGFV